MVASGLRRRSPLLLSLAVLAACRASGPPQPPRPDPSAALRAEIARAEAQRGAGVPQLLTMIGASEPVRAQLAIRALGRIGGQKARRALLERLACMGGTSAAATGAATGAPTSASAAPAALPCRPGEATWAAAALGLSGALDDVPAGELSTVSAALVAALGKAAAPADQATVIEALGRAGDAASQPALSAALGRGGVVAEAAAIALGRHGRRSIAWSAEVRGEVVRAAAHHDASLRYAATWALSREFSPPPPGDPASATVASALTLRLGDADGETRAAAVAGLARRKLVPLAGEAVAGALGDADWRVVIEAMRALAANAAALGNAADADLLAATVTAHLKALAGDAGGAPGDAQIVVEGLRQLMPHGARPQVAAALRAALQSAEAVRPRAHVAAGWILCLSQAGLLRAEAAPDPGKLASCGGKDLSAAYGAGLVAELTSAGVGSAPARRAALDGLWASPELRVKNAALQGLPPSLVGVDAASASANVARLAEALASKEAMLVSTAVESLGEVWPAAGLPGNLDPIVRTALESVAQSLILRAAGERDAEVAGALLDFIGERKLRGGEPSCRAQAQSAQPVIARAAVRCLAALEGAPPPVPAEPPAAEAPPVELALGAGAGARWRWKLTTEHGIVEIELDSAAAPWHVAAIVQLTQKHFYDGLEFHRVVPNFVVQGGDPTQSGSGGPGFSLPAEPGSRADGDSYRAGAVGFADAGKDSGGSQWFVMHSRAPHLEGRYTRVGQLSSGQQVIDRLLVGDKVLTAQVTALPR